MAKHHLRHSDCAAPSDIISITETHNSGRFTNIKSISQTFLIIYEKLSKILPIAAPNSWPESFLKFLFCSCNLLISFDLFILIMKKVNWQMAFSRNLDTCSSQKFEKTLPPFNFGILMTSRNFISFLEQSTFNLSLSFFSIRDTFHLHCTIIIH